MSLNGNFRPENTKNKPECLLSKQLLEPLCTGQRDSKYIRLTGSTTQVNYLIYTRPFIAQESNKLLGRFPSFVKSPLKHVARRLNRSKVAS